MATVKQIELQEKKVTKLIAQKDKAVSNEHYQNTFSRKHTAAKRKVENLRTEIEIEQSILYRMKDV